MGTQQAAGDNALDHSAELFMAADAKMLTIGGGCVSFYCLDLKINQQLLLFSVINWVYHFYFLLITFIVKHLVCCYVYIQGIAGPLDG